MAEEVLAIGKKAPAFTLPSTLGRDLALNDLAGERGTVLFFYPRAGTPGCTREACSLRDDLAKLQRQGFGVAGISPDPLPRVQKFALKHKLTYPLLADADHRVSQQFGVWGQRSFMGVKYNGVRRTTFILDPGGKILHVFAKVKVLSHGQQVVDWVSENLKQA